MVTYIRTFDELIMTGWRVEIVSDTFVLRHPDTSVWIVDNMIPFLGQRREYGRACAQNTWTWPAEALEEKEV
jgi:hypothetical protein